MIERVADLFYQWLEGDEVQYHARAIQFTFHGNRNLIVMSVQRFSSAISKNQKVSRCEIEIVFGDFDAKTTCHVRESIQKALFFQDEDEEIGEAMTFFGSVGLWRKKLLF